MSNFRKVEHKQEERNYSIRRKKKQKLKTDKEVIDILKIMNEEYN